MISPYVIFGLGIVVSLANVYLWGVIIRSQLRQLHKSKMNMRIKKLLLIFSGVSLASNFMPVWFDIYQIGIHQQHTNISYAYIISQYLFRTTVAWMFYLIYKV